MSVTCSWLLTQKTFDKSNIGSNTQENGCSVFKYWVFLWMYYVLCTLCLLVISDRILANLIRLLGILIIFMLYLLCTQEWQKSNEYVFPQGPQPTDYSELMNLVSAQQTTLQSQHAEIKQASILQCCNPKQSLSE